MGTLDLFKEAMKSYLGKGVRTTVDKTVSVDGKENTKGWPTRRVTGSKQISTYKRVGLQGLSKQLQKDLKLDSQLLLDLRLEIRMKEE